VNQPIPNYLQEFINGTMGIIRINSFTFILTYNIDSVIFAPGQEPHNDLLLVVMVEISSYRDSTEWYTDDGVSIVLIIPSVARCGVTAKESCDGAANCSWTVGQLLLDVGRLANNCWTLDQL
jgi:hypothetical protein